MEQWCQYANDSVIIGTLDYDDAAITSKRRITKTLISKAIDFLSNDKKNRAETDLLYNVVQFLMAESLSHFILSHGKLADAPA